MSDSIITFETPEEPLPIEVPRVHFVESELPEEPKSDRLLVTSTGDRLRERITAMPTNDGQHGRGFMITLTLLDDENNVLLDLNGKPIISQHDIRFTAEAGRNLGTAEAIADATMMSREIAAAKAVKEIEAQQMIDTLFSDRV